MTALTALVTGFDPFAGNTVNASWQAVSMLPQCIDLPSGPLRLHTRCLPVTYAQAPALIRALIQELTPDIVICVGLAQTSAKIALETRAVNEAHAEIADNAGVRLTRHLLRVDGPPTLAATWHAAALVGRLSAAGMPVIISHDAGRFVCNATLYAALDESASTLSRPVGFIHVPPAEVCDTTTVVDALTRVLRDLTEQVRRHQAWQAGLRRATVARGKRPRRVAVTGGIGSGKSTVARLLADCGAYVVDADALARDIVAPGTSGLQQIVVHFGTTMLRDDGTLDRAEMARVIFADDDARTHLESLLLPHIACEAARRMESAGPAGIAVYDVPLLAEGHMADLFDDVVVVTAPLELRLSRLAQRGMTHADALARMVRQASDDERVALADELLVNDGDRQKLSAQVDRLWARLCAD